MIEKYKDELLEKKINSLSQPDRMEYYAIKTNSSQQVIGSTIAVAHYSLLVFICSIFGANSLVRAKYINELGLNILSNYVFLYRVLAVLGLFFATICAIALILYAYKCTRSYQESKNNQIKFLEERSKK